MTTATVDTIVRERYSAAAQAPEAALCCPVEYDTRYLEAIPEEIIAKTRAKYIEAYEKLTGETFVA